MSALYKVAITNEPPEYTVTLKQRPIVLLNKAEWAKEVNYYSDAAHLIMTTFYQTIFYLF